MTQSKQVTKHNTLPEIPPQVTNAQGGETDRIGSRLTLSKLHLALLKEANFLFFLGRMTASGEESSLDSSSDIWARKEQVFHNGEWTRFALLTLKLLF